MLSTTLHKIVSLFLIVFSCVLVANAETIKAHYASDVVATKANLFTIGFELKQAHFPINQFHEWIITIKNNDGKPVYPAKINIGGGMPAHGHGLPTQPIVTKYLGNGRYLVEGMKFNMDGHWVVAFQIVTPSAQDTAKFEFDVEY